MNIGQEDTYFSVFQHPADFEAEHSGIVGPTL